MRFVDEAHITVRSGKGGDGAISFRREKYVPKGGPDGGNGGTGGSIIFLADPQLSTLLDFRYKRHYSAKDGVQGGTNNKTGRSAEDLVIHVPVGTIIRNEETDDIIADLDEPFEQKVIAKGGYGGLGNAEFKTSTNQAPRHRTKGKPGQEFSLHLELKLLADVALVGFPNAGKSTLISRISAAKPKIADYPFTTLVPNLGIVQAPEEHRSFVVADIPGLIEGASQGKGLGFQFLRHIERSRLLLYLLDGTDAENPPEIAFATLRKEIKNYSDELSQKPFIVAITKIDAVGSADIKTLSALRFARKKPLLISSASGLHIDELIKELWEKIRERND
jgi:GTP-binding protein